jgi:hypothetical protein
LQIKDEPQDERPNDPPRLKPQEAAVLALLAKRLSRTLKDKLEESLALAKSATK